MFGIKNLQERVAKLEKWKLVNKNLVDEMRRFLPFRGFDKLPTHPDSMYTESWVLEDMLALLVHQQKQIEEITKPSNLS